MYGGQEGDGRARAASNGRAIDAVHAATYDKAMKKLKGEKKEDLRRFLSKEMPHEEQRDYVLHLHSQLHEQNQLHDWYTQCIKACVGSKAKEQREDAARNLEHVKRERKALHAHLLSGTS